MTLLIASPMRCGSHLLGRLVASGLGLTPGKVQEISTTDPDWGSALDSTYDGWYKTHNPNCAINYHTNPDLIVCTITRNPLDAWISRYFYARYRAPITSGTGTSDLLKAMPDLPEADSEAIPRVYNSAIGYKWLAELLTWRIPAPHPRHYHFFYEELIKDPIDLVTETLGPRLTHPITSRIAIPENNLSDPRTRHHRDGSPLQYKKYLFLK